MTILNRHTEVALDKALLERALELLAFRLRANGVKEATHLVVCGGSALILTGLVPRATRDVDIVAMLRSGHLASPEPLPPELLKAANEVAADLGLNKEWLNNGPSKDIGGLFQMGLPNGLQERLIKKEYGELLSVYFISRIDQIFFKLYAAVDRGGYHITDLLALNPNAEELEDAARWTMTHDVSDGYQMVLKRLLSELGFTHVSERL